MIYAKARVTVLRGAVERLEIADGNVLVGLDEKYPEKPEKSGELSTS